MSKKKLHKLIGYINETESLLHLIKDNAEAEIFEIQGNKGIQNWTIQNERLNTIIAKFTIFSHKKTVSDLAGTTVESEEIAESGDVTLF